MFDYYDIFLTTLNGALFYKYTFLQCLYLGEEQSAWIVYMATFSSSQLGEEMYMSCSVVLRLSMVRWTVRPQWYMLLLDMSARSYCLGHTTHAPLSAFMTCDSPFEMSFRLKASKPNQSSFGIQLFYYFVLL